MTLFEKIRTKEELHLEDICEIETAIKEIMQYKYTKINGINIGRGFPFEDNFLSVYTNKLIRQFELDKEVIMNLVTTDLFLNKQIFETEVTLIGDKGYIRYLFPVPYATALIKQSGIETKEVNVEALYQYTKHIEVDFNANVENETPVIILDYPYSSPGFFVIDGNHRVAKAYKSQIEKYKAFILRDNAISLIAPAKVFALLAKIHRNLCLICMYYVGEIDLGELKTAYENIDNEKML